MTNPRNVVVVQSGGPTSVINNSLRGMVEACVPVAPLTIMLYNIRT